MKYEISYRVVDKADPEKSYITTRTMYATDISQAIFLTGQWAEINHPADHTIGQLIAVIAHDAPIICYRKADDLGNVGAYRKLPPGPKGGD